MSRIFVSMAFISTTATQGRRAGPARKKVSFASSQAMARQRAYEKKSKKHKIKLVDLTVFTRQLASMIEAGLPVVGALEALQEQQEDPVFAIIIRDVRNDVAAGNPLSSSAAKFPRAFPRLFISMVAAGEASGGLASILGRVAGYFEETLKLMKKVKSAMTYPIAVMGLAVILVNVLLIFVIPVFAEMFEEVGAELPMPTQMLISFSDFMKSYILFVLIGAFILFKMLMKFVSTPGGRRVKDKTLLKLPIMGELRRKISLSRFCRTFAILMQSGVPILRNLDIVSKASDNVFIEDACAEISKSISQGGQVSDVLASDPYFPPMMKHMVKAGERTGNVDGMVNKVADFYDSEVDATVASLTSLMEPIMIVIIGIIVGGMVMAMFLPIFNLAPAIGG